MSRDPTATSADLWPPSGLRKLRIASVVHLLVISSSFVSCHDEQVDTQADDYQFVAGRNGRPQLQPIRPNPSKPPELTMSASLDQLYFEQPRQFQGHLQHHQQQPFSTRLPQIAYTSEQQKYIADLLRSQQQQLQLLQQQHQNHKLWSQNYPPGSFYSFTGDLDEEQLSAAQLDEPVDSAQVISGKRRRRPFSNQITSLHEQGPPPPTPPPLSYSPAYPPSSVAANSNQMNANSELRKWQTKYGSGFDGSPPLKHTDKQIRLIPVHSSLNYEPTAATTTSTSTTSTTTSTTTTPAPIVRREPSHERTQAIQIVGGTPARPKLAINLSSLIKPGEVLLSSKAVEKYSARDPGSVRRATSVVGVKEVENILQDLKPLALAERDKATGLETAMPLPTDSPDALSALEQDEQGKDRDYEPEEEEGPHHDQLERVLPTSHLFGGSAAGLINGGANEVGHNNHSKADDLAAPTGSGAKDDNDDGDDQTASFAKVLKTLGSQLSDEDSPEQNYVGSASTREDDFYGLSRAAQRAAGRQSRRGKSSLGVPIELLVDHLMAGSRLATRQGDDVFERAPTPEEDAANAGQNSMQTSDDPDQDDEEDEDEEEDADDDQQMPEDIGANSLVTNESKTNETRVLPNDASETVNYNSVANSSESWIPMSGDPNKDRLRSAQTGRKRVPSAQRSDVIVGRRPAGSHPGDSAKQKAPMDSESERGGPRGRGRQKRKKKRRPRSRDRREGFVIGNKRLSRLELIRLIKVLNKMANDKRPSKERETSRRLLRHLIKVAIENYKQSQERARLEEGEQQRQQPKPKQAKGEITDKRLRESLRSLLLEPTLGSSNSSGNTTKVSVVMQPWRVKAALIQAERHDGEVDDQDVVTEPPSSLNDPADSDLKRPKTLVDISDDLERYFDTDFFEDLADRKNASAASKTDTPATLPTPLKRQKTPAASTDVPVPIVLNGKQADDADEEDVDLDHVRVKTTKATTGGSGGGSSANEPRDRQARQQRKRTRAGRGRKRRRKALKKTTAELKGTKAQSKESARVHDDDEEDEADAESERPRTRPEESKTSNKSVKQERSNRRRNRDELGDGRDLRNEEEQKKARHSQGKPRRDEDETTTAAKADEEEDPASERDEEQSENQEKQADSEAPKSKRRRSGQRRAENEKRRRRKRRLKAKQKYDKGRDEIPAPIVSGRMSRNGASTKKPAPFTATSSTKTASSNRPKAPAMAAKDKLANSSLSNKRNGATKSQSRDSKRAKTKSSQTNKEDQSKKSKKTGAKKPPPVEVVNYFNEGLEICEDGKCKLAMKSSHPKVKEHLKKQPDKRDLAGQIDKWLQEDGISRLD